MKLKLTLWLGVVLGSLLHQPLMAEVAQVSEEEFKGQMMLEGKNVSYQDENGNVIDFKVFIGLLAEGDPVMKEVLDDGAIIIRTAPASFKIPEPTNLSIEHTGKETPPAEGVDIEGKRLVESFANGKYTLVSFFFAGCVPCIYEVPILNRFVKDNPTVDVLAVTFDELKDTKKFVKQTGLTLPVLSEAGSFIDEVGVMGYPTLMLLDPQGRFVSKKIGGIIDGEKDGYDELNQWYLESIKG
ncbi:hypothetical protein GCM10007978_25630 [Shewanella hanedai]|uniref:TlpA family protein disulfide reductase n=1 Tax=Shewanella hanedai TaxID=25 RepID=A0A553JMT4_SHEHA|nr:TlpA disulfide reductase family protein [Shewanella hanedai]TRY13772.1 TlpA family protein disulfide reductase [Shewanella hanedai]GGI86779.1 hypothetical protein GCM10007978_25630 [Shewanella hanedai]